MAGDDVNSAAYRLQRLERLVHRMRNPPLPDFPFMAVLRAEFIAHGEALGHATDTDARDPKHRAQRDAARRSWKALRIEAERLRQQVQSYPEFRAELLHVRGTWAFRLEQSERAADDALMVWVRT